MTQMPSKSTPPGGIDLRRLWSRKGLILSVTLLSVAIGAAYLVIAEDVYEVQTRLYLNNAVDPTKVIQDDGREDRFFVGTQAEVIGSPSIVRKALEKAPVTLPPGTDDDLMTYVLESLTVSPVVNTEVLSIRYQGPKEEEAVRFVEALVESYQQHLKTIDTSTSTEAVELLAQREAELRAKLERLEAEYAEQRRASPLIGEAEKQLEANTLVLAEVGQALTAARVRHIGLKNQLAAMPVGRNPDSAVASTVSYHKPAQPGGDSSPEDAPHGAAFKADPVALSRDVSRMALGYEGEGATDLLDVEQQLRLAVLKKSRANEKLGEFHPLHREVDAEVATWRQLRDETMRVAVDSLQQQLEIEAATQEHLEELYEQEQQKAKSLDDHLVREKVLRAEIARTEGVYNAVFSRLTDTELVDQALSNGRASVIVRNLDGPHLKAEKLWPQPLIMMPACAIFGLACGIVVAFAADASSSGRPRNAPHLLPEGAAREVRNGAPPSQEGVHA